MNVKADTTRLDKDSVVTWLRENQRSQAWLAGRLQVGRAAVNKWLTGERNPTRSHVDAMEAAMGLALGSLGVGA